MASQATFIPLLSLNETFLEIGSQKSGTGIPLVSLNETFLDIGPQKSGTGPHALPTWGFSNWFESDGNEKS